MADRSFPRMNVSTVFFTVLFCASRSTVENDALFEMMWILVQVSNSRRYLYCMF